MAILNRIKQATTAAATTRSPNTPTAPGPNAAAVSPSAAQPVGAHGAAASKADEAESVIGNDFSIEGESITIRCHGLLRVNGRIHATLHSRRLVVGEQARITGAIVAEDVSVFGQVDGSISGATVRLQPTAVVDGDIQAHSLTIDSGAKFEGRSRWVDDPAEIAPQTAPPIEAGALAETRQITEQPHASPIPMPTASAHVPPTPTPVVATAPTAVSPREDVRNHGAARSFFSPEARVPG